MKKRKQKDNTRQIQELMIIECSMYYLTSFLEKAGVIKDNVFVAELFYKEVVKNV